MLCTSKTLSNHSECVRIPLCRRWRLISMVIRTRFSSQLLSYVFPPRPHTDVPAHNWGSATHLPCRSRVSRLWDLPLLALWHRSSAIPLTTELLLQAAAAARVLASIPY